MCHDYFQSLSPSLGNFVDEYYLPMIDYRLNEPQYLSTVHALEKLLKNFRQILSQNPPFAPICFSFAVKPYSN